MKAFLLRRGAGMLAIDTNVIVRYLVADDRQQSLKAKALIDSEDVFICTTVLLETEWVLRSVYGFSAADVAAALRAVAGLPTCTLEEPETAAEAIDWSAKGMDFADALLLTKAEKCDAVATFDRRFAKVARRLGAVVPLRPF